MEEIIKQISIQTGKDQRVIKVICEHPFLFSKHVIEDPNDDRPVMIKYFGKFVCKHAITTFTMNLNVKRYLKNKAIAKEQ